MDASEFPETAALSRRRRYRGLVVGSALLLVLISALPEPSATWIYGWPQLLILPAGIVVLLGALCGSMWFNDPGARLSRMWECCVAGIFASAAVSLIVNQSLSISYAPLLTLVAGLLAFVVVAVLIKRDPEVAALLGMGVGITGFIVVSFSTYHWVMSDIPVALGLLDPLNSLAGVDLLHFSFAENRNAHPFGHQNYSAGAVLLFVPWHVWLFHRSRHRQKLVWSVAILLDLVCLMSTFSRGAWMGLAGGGAVFLLWLRISERIPKRLFNQLVVGALLVGTILVAANPRLRSSVISLATRGTTQVDQVRSSMATAGWLIFADFPILGVGAGNVTSVYPRYRAQLPFGLEDNYQLHITPLQIAAEHGVVGLVAWGGLGLAGWRSFRRLRRESRDVGAAAFFALLCYGIFSLTDYQLDVLPILLLIFLNCAVLAGLGKPELDSAPIRRQNLFPLVMVIGSFAALLVAIPEFRGRSEFSAAMTALKEKRRELFEWKAGRAVSLAPFPVYYLNQLAASHAELWANSTNVQKRQTYFGNATNRFQQSLEANPSQEFCHFNLGWMNQEADSLLSAQHFISAARLVPDRAGVFRGLARSLVKLGETNAALKTLSLECLVNPGFVASAFWSHAGYGDLWPGVFTNLMVDLRRAASEHPVDSPMRRTLDNRATFIEWLHTGDMALIEETRWPAHMSEFWQAVRSNSTETIRDLDPRAAWRYLHDAWADESNRRQLIIQAVILSTEQTPNDAVVDELVSWVAKEKWSDVIRETPPPELFRAYGRQRSGFNLMARNMDGIKPTDVCAYVDNHVVELFFEFLYGTKTQVSSIFVLRRLDEILEELPQEFLGDPVLGSATLIE